MAKKPMVRLRCVSDDVAGQKNFSDLLLYIGVDEN